MSERPFLYVPTRKEARKAMTEKLDLIWGARRIADTLGVPEHRVTRLFDKGQLPFVRRVGKMLVGRDGRGAEALYFRPAA